MPIDYSRYPPNWKTEIVPRILERAEHKCELCGLENGQKVWSVAVWLKDGSRYKVKRIWLSDDGDMIRLKAVSVNGETKKVKVVLTIAHLDHDETNHDVADDRLRAWCQHCHLNYDATEKMRRIMAKAEQRDLLSAGEASK